MAAGAASSVTSSRGTGVGVGIGGIVSAGVADCAAIAAGATSSNFASSIFAPAGAAAVSFVTRRSFSSSLNSYASDDELIMCFMAERSTVRPAISLVKFRCAGELPRIAPCIHACRISVIVLIVVECEPSDIVVTA